jgi:hypothetical protein
VLAADLDAVGEVGDQRHAKADSGAVDPRAQPDAVVDDGDLDALVIQARGHVDLAGLLAVAVGVDHRVGDRLGNHDADGVSIDGDSAERFQNRSARS